MHRAAIVALPLFALACSDGAEDAIGEGREAHPSETLGAPVEEEEEAKPGRAAVAFDPRVDAERASGSSNPPPAPTTPTPTPSPTTPPAPTTPPPATPNPGPPPSQTCTVTKDANGFFVRSSGKSDYVAYVPASYSPSIPMRVVVGMHGCGDTAMNFATWAVNPWATRATQTHIGISVGGETGANKCWSMGGDDAKVLAAVDDLAKCFWVHKAKVTVAGFSSGGQLAYRVGLMNASRFAGILIENASLYAADSNPDALLANASRKLPIAHRAHSGDTVFPIAKVKADWQKTSAAGFPLETSEVAGGHDGTGEDWSGWLLAKSASWSTP